jgi:hypothetical protein
VVPGTSHLSRRGCACVRGPSRDLSMRNGPTKTFDVAHQFHFSRLTESGVTAALLLRTTRGGGSSLVAMRQRQTQTRGLVAPATGFVLKPLASGHGPPRCRRCSPSRFGYTLRWNRYLVHATGSTCHQCWLQSLSNASVAGSLWVCARWAGQCHRCDRGIPYSSVLLDGRRAGVWRHRSALVWAHGGLSFGLDATVMHDQMPSTGLPSVTSTKEFR